MSNPGKNEEIMELSQPVDLNLRLGRSAMAVVFALLLAVCSRVLDEAIDPEAGQHRITFWFLGVSLVIAAVLSPLHSAIELDPARRELHQVWYYGRLAVRRQRWPVSAFGRVVVTHREHRNESGVSYTAEVGLTRSGGAVLWVRTYPATESGVTADTRDFAAHVGNLTGLTCQDSPDWHASSWPRF